MSKLPVSLRALIPMSLLVAAPLALAAGWSNFEAAFPPLPCMDGWAGCLVDGKVVSPGMVLDQGRRPHPAQMRMGFFDGDALPGLSPFEGLSEYTAAAEPPPDEKPEPAPTPAPRAERDPEPEREERVAAAPAPEPEREERVAVAAAPSRTERPDPLPRTSPIPRTSLTPPPRVERTPEPEPEPVRRPEREERVAARAVPEPRPEPTPAPEPEPKDDAVAMAAAPEDKPAPRPTRPPAQDNSCDDIIALEAPAMMGQLGAPRRACLDKAIATTGSQTQKSKLSLLLLVDAEAAGDRSAWVNYIKRHLNQIDRSDPNLCMKYAVYLYRSNSGQEAGVIRWANYALENKQSWSGSSYKRNVYTLYKLRAQAANRQWERANKRFLDDRSDESEDAESKARGKLKSFAREWLDYAKASGQSTQAPLALCVSAAGSADFCQG